MNRPIFHHLRTLAILCITCVISLFLLLAATPALAQTEDTSKVTIHIDNMETITVIKTDTGEFQKLNGNVILRQGTDTLYCDSALQNTTTKNFEAFSNVRIAQQGGTHGTSDYLRYTSSQKEAYMSGNVQLTDGKNHLSCTELTYNLGTKVAVYDKGGKLHNDSTTITSKWGEYDIQNKIAKFKDHVVILDTQYQVRSENVVYHTETKVTDFYARSVVTRDSGRSILETTNGSYDGKNGIAHFLAHSSIWNRGQYIEGDTLYYNKLTGYGLADGHVISIDTGRHSTMYCGHAEYHQRQRTLLATLKPVLEQVNGKDTLYIRADTFYSAPMAPTRRLRVDSLKRSPAADSMTQALMPHGAGRPDTIMYTHADSMLYAHKMDSIAQRKEADSLIKAQNAADDKLKPTISGKYHVPTKHDTLVRTTGKKKRRKSELQSEPMITTDSTAEADSTAPLYFIGYHHVLIFSDSMQGRCDSVVYTRADSLIRMIYSPIVWSRKSQITGDTILMQLDSSTLRKLFVPANAFVVSQSGPDKAQLYDQVQGKTLTSYFASNTITQIIVKPEAQSIYYSKDEKGAYLGVVQASGIRMFIHFEDQKIKSIKYDKDAHAVMTPMLQADLPNTRLSKFKWLDSKRPRSKEELFK